MTRPPDFDRVARIYRWAEYIALGPLLHRTRTHFLSRLSSPRCALLLGDGDGRFTAALLRQNPQTTALAVDTSASMLQLLRTRCADSAARLQTLHASALDVSLSPRTDLVVTHFFLDCLTQSEVDALALRFSAEATMPLTWLISDFRVPHAGFARPLARVYIRALYFAFRVLTGLRVQTLPDVRSALSAASFRLDAQHSSVGGMLYTELWTLQKPSSALQSRHLP